MFRESPGRTRYLTEAETQRLLGACGRHVRPLVLAALHTGARRGELLKLCWRDVDLDSGTVTFGKETTKSGKTRYVPLTPELAESLRQMRSMAEAMASCGWEQERVFTYQGKPFRSPRGGFKLACKRAGLQDHRSHDLRHSFASSFMMKGGDIYVLKELLGHSTILMTERYSHLSPNHVRSALRFMGSGREEVREEEAREPEAPLQEPCHPAPTRQSTAVASDVDLLFEVREVFRRRQAHVITTVELVTELTRDPRWEVLRTPSPQEAGRRLSGMLRRFGLGPSQLHSQGQETKGYRLEDLALVTMRVLGTDRGAR